jgi:hypothetical protein
MLSNTALITPSPPPRSVLRLCGEDMQLAGGTLEAVLRQMRDPEMDELDLSSQRADVNQASLI